MKFCRTLFLQAQLAPPSVDINLPTHSFVPLSSIRSSNIKWPESLFQISASKAVLQDQFNLNLYPRLLVAWQNEEEAVEVVGGVVELRRLAS
jgi:hypothetical protein